MARLIVQAGTDVGSTHVLAGQKVTVGRSVNNDLQIVDRRMSRNHAEFEMTPEGGYLLRDLGSRNGTTVNDKPVVGTIVLRAGDRVGIGDTVFLFEEDTGSQTDPGSTTRMPAIGKKESSSSSFRIVEERQWGSTKGERRAGMEPVASVSFDSRDGTLKDSHKRLEILYQVTEAIRTVYTQQALLDRIMEIIFGVFHPDRGYLLLIHPETHELVPEVVKHGGAAGVVERDVKISSTIVDRCLKEGVSLLVSDAAADNRFSASESIIMNRIRTAMVAPLVYKQQSLGVVYIDTQTRVVAFTEEELELLTGITNQAALAILNTRMQSQLVEQHKLAREMEIARAIQMNLLPKTYPELDGYEISAMSLPAKQVGGDYYDFLPLVDGRIGLAVADVSGKGVPAAFLTATTRSYLQSETQHPHNSIKQTVERMNKMVHRDVTNDMYVTMVLLYLDPVTGDFEYINAGHTYPQLYDTAGQMQHLRVGGFFLGIMEDSVYQIGRGNIPRGGLLVLYTDGVTDILDPKGEAWGGERFQALLKQNQHLGAESIRNAVYQACLKHRGDADQFDDFTLIVLKRLAEVDSGFDEIDS